MDAGELRFASTSLRRALGWLAPLGLAFGGTAFMLVLWQLGVTLSGSDVLPGPAAVAKGVVELARSGRLASYVADSLLRVAVGFGLALVSGLPFGLAMGYFPRFGSAVHPLIQLLRPISPLAWTPLAVIAFGIDNITPIFLIFLSSFCAIAEATKNSVPTVSGIYVLAARNFGLSRSAVFMRVIFPAAFPSILSGIRLSLGVAWVVVVAAEMIAVDSGLGYLIIDARNAGKRYDLVVAGMVLIGVIGLLLDSLVISIERLPALRWGAHNRG